MVARDAGATAALLGVEHVSAVLTDLGPGLHLVEAANDAALTVHDAGALATIDAIPEAGEDVLLAVLGGPCYLAVQTLVLAAVRPRPMGSCFCGRRPQLTAGDVADVTSIPVVAPKSPRTAAVARGSTPACC